MIEKVAFTMVPIRDTDRARAFYERTLGLAVGKASSNGVWTEYDLPGGGCVALFRSADLAPTSGAGSVAYEVKDLDAMVAHLKKEGVKFQMEDVKSPVCRMAIALDSEGNSIILHQLHAK